jgi:hypothetical protein
MTLAILTTVQRLDRDKDGFWTESEALAIGPEWVQKFPARLANIKRVFAAFMEYVKERKLLAQDGMSMADSKRLTNNFTAIPMTWMVKEQPIIDICEAGDPNVCGNFEVRGILKEKLPHLDNIEDRIRQCEWIAKKYCAHILGERYRLYSQWTGELCGDLETNWDGKHEVRTVKYQEAKTFTSGAGVVTFTYQSFLVVILAVWFLVCLSEVREVINWWLVMLFMADSNGGSPFEVEDDSITVNSIPRSVRWMSVLLNLLPRTGIALGLCYIGTDFLLSADNYNNLIFNVVALGFLIEIDNMLFHAVVDRNTKETVENCSPLKVFREPNERLDFLERHVGVTFMWTMVTLLAVLGCLLHAYLAPGGKFEMGEGLTCLCHVEGPACMSAQVSGALPHL